MAGPVTAHPFPHERFRDFDTASVGHPAPIPRERLAYLTRRIHSLGERPLFEFIHEIEAGAPLHRTLERYSELWVLRGFIEVNDGDRLSAPRVVRGGHNDEA